MGLKQSGSPVGLSFTKGLQFFPDTVFHGRSIVGVDDFRIIEVEDVFEFVTQDELIDDCPVSYFLPEYIDLIIGRGVGGNARFSVSGLFPCEIFPVRDDVNGYFVNPDHFVEVRGLGQGLEPSFMVFGADFSVLR